MKQKGIRVSFASRSCVLILTVILFAGDAPLSHQLELVFGLALLGVLAASFLRPLKTRPGSLYIALSIAAVGIGLPLLFGPPAFRPVGLSCNLLGVFFASRKTDQAGQALMFAAISSLCAAFLWMLRSSPLLWSVMNDVSLRISDVIHPFCQSFIGTGMRFRSAFLLEPFMPFLILIAAIALWADADRSRSRLLRIAICLALPLCACLLYLAAAAGIIAFLQSGYVPAWYHDRGECLRMATLLLPQCLQIAMLAALWLIVRIVRPRPACLQSGGKASAVVFAMCFVLCLMPGALRLVQPPGPSRADGESAVLLEHKSARWRPVENADLWPHHPHAMGAFNMLMQSLGYRTQTAGRLDDSMLSDADLLVISRLEKPLTYQEHEAVWQFVNGGGRMLVLGEGTAVSAGGRLLTDPAGLTRLNELLGPAAIRFQPGSAADMAGRWELSLRDFTDPFDKAPIVDAQIANAAALSISSPARPLLVGRFGLYDLPEICRNESPGLPDGQYDRHESLGDVVLAAGQTLGRGSVTVASVSSATNMSIPESWEWMAGLMLRPATRPAPSNTLVVVALAAWAVALALISIRPTHYGLAAGLALMCLAALGWFARPASGPLPKGPVVYQDDSHLPDYSKASRKKRGTLTFRHGLLRNGRLPLVLPELDPARLAGASALICHNPAAAYTPAEMRVLREFVNEGGSILLTTGRRGRPGSMALLDEFGLRLRQIELGEVAVEAPEAPARNMRLLEAVPIEQADDKAGKALPVLLAKPLTAADRADTVGVAVGSGKGWFVAIGGAKALLNENLGDPWELKPPYRDLAAWMCERYVPISQDKEGSR